MQLQHLTRYVSAAPMCFPALLYLCSLRQIPHWLYATAFDQRILEIITPKSISSCRLDTHGTVSATMVQPSTQEWVYRGHTHMPYHGVLMATRVPAMVWRWLYMTSHPTGLLFGCVRACRTNMGRSMDTIMEGSATPPPWQYIQTAMKSTSSLQPAIPTCPL